MPEYIERQAAKKALADSGLVPRYKADNRCVTDRVIDAVPAADVAPVVHGRWEVYLDGKELMCSYCKTTFWDEEQVGGSNYCPYCGARMDLEDKL